MCILKHVSAPKRRRGDQTIKIVGRRTYVGMLRGAIRRRGDATRESFEDNAIYEGNEAIDARYDLPKVRCVRISTVDRI